MNKKQKIAIDRVFGLILSLALRLPALLLEKTLKRNHCMPPSEAPKRIVVAKYLGIGSIIQASPMIRDLKKKYPHSFLIFLSLKANHQLLSRYKFIDHIICVDDTTIVRVLLTSLSATLELIFKRIDLFLDLEAHSTYGSLMCFLSCSKNRLGFSLEDEDHRAFLYTHLLYLNTSFPIRYCYSQLGQLAGIDPPKDTIEPLCPDLYATDLNEAQNKIEEIFNFEHLGIIAINPNASDLRYERRWSREGFAAVARYFAKQGYAVALVGASSEHDYIEGIVKMMDDETGRVRNVAGKFTLLEFFAFLKHCRLLVTNDSGIMNIGLTLPIPQLLLAGPVDPEQYFMPNKFRTYIYYQTYCSPCTHYIAVPPCGGDNVCMQQIQYKEVVEFCERLLGGDIMHPKRNNLFSYHSDILGVLKNIGEDKNTNKLSNTTK
jgi:ADP-heptose:LPS heptosyltransferase